MKMLYNTMLLIKLLGFRNT